MTRCYVSKEEFKGGRNPNQGSFMNFKRMSYKSFFIIALIALVIGIFIMIIKNIYNM
jgi:hypothetical protein